MASGEAAEVSIVFRLSTPTGSLLPLGQRVGHQLPPLSWGGRGAQRAGLCHQAPSMPECSRWTQRAWRPVPGRGVARLTCSSLLEQKVYFTNHSAPTSPRGIQNFTDCLPYWPSLGSSSISLLVGWKRCSHVQKSGGPKFQPSDPPSNSG